MFIRISEAMSGWRWRTLDPNIRRSAVSYGLYGSGIATSKAIADTAQPVSDAVATVQGPVLHTVNGANPLSILDMFPSLAEAGYLSVTGDGSLFILGISSGQFFSMLTAVITILFLVLRFIGDFALWLPSWKIKRADFEEMRALNAEAVKELRSSSPVDEE